MAVTEEPSADGLRERLADLDAVYRLADAVGRAEGLDETLEAALDALVGALAVDRASVLLVGEDGVMRFAAWRGLSDGYRAAVEGHSPWPVEEPEPQPVLVADARRDDGLGPFRATILAEGIGALAFVPLVHRGRLLGKFMLYRDRPHDWTGREVQLAGAIASHVAAAVERFRAQERLHESRSQLEAVLRQVADGITVQDREGRLVYANDAAARMVGYPSAEAMVAAPVSELVARFEILDEHRRPLPLDRLPGRLALAGLAAPETLVCYRIRATGEERWSVVRASPVLGADGRVEFAVNTFNDITERKLAADRLAFLADAGETLASSLDVDETLAALSRLAVPALADWCVVDTLDQDGRLRRVGAAHAEPAKAALLRDIPSPRGYARVVAEGAPLLLEGIDEARLAEAARSPEHLGLLRELAPHSLICVPLVSRGRTLGAITLVASDPGRAYGELDVRLAEELGRRAALAVDNAFLFREAGDVLGALDSFLASAPVAIGLFDRDLRYVRVNDALAELNGRPAGEHVGRRLADVVPDIAPAIEPVYRHVLATGEPVTREESTETLAPRLGPQRHWIARYFPVRAADGELVGVGVLLTEITERRRLAETQTFLAEATDALASSLDYEETLREVARLSVPRLADWCIVYERAADGALRRLAVEHSQGQAERVVSVLERFPLDPAATAGVPAVIRTGEPILLPEITAEQLVADVEGAEALRSELADLVLSSYLCVPLVARGRTLGAIALLEGETGRRFGDEQLALATELARRAALHVDNARLYRAAERAAERERRRSDQLLRLANAALVVNAAGSLDEILAAVEAQARDIVGAQEASISLGEGDGSTTGRGDLAARVRTENRSLRTTAGEAGPAALAAPLVGRDGGNIGVVELRDRGEGGDFGVEDEAILVQLAQLASIAIENARLFAESRSSLALVDAILATAPIGFAFVDPGLRFLRVNDAMAALNALPVEAHLGRRPTELGPGYEEVEAVLDEVRTTGEPVLERELSGGGRDFVASYFPVRSASDGELLGIGALVVDVTERNRLLRELEEQRGLFEAVITQMPAGVIVAEAPSGRLLLGNEQVERIWGGPFVDADRVEEYGEYRGFRPDGTPLRPEEWPLARAIGAGEVVDSEEIAFERFDGTHGVMEVRAAPVRDVGGAIRAGVVTFDDVTERKRAEEERGALLRAEQAARERLSVLAEASRTLTESLDYEATLAALARLVVPALADWCAVSVLEADGSINVVAWTHSDPERQRWADEQRAVRRIHIDDATPTAQVLRTGEPVLFPELTEEALASVQPEDRALVDAMGIRSLMAVPFSSGRGTVGSIMFISAESGRRFDDDDLLLARELGRRAGVAIENARLYRETESRAKAAEALEFVADGVLLVDRDGAVRVWNPAAEAITGLRAEELVGRQAAEAIPGWSELAARVPLPEAGDPAPSRAETVPVELGGREAWLSIAGVAFEAGTVYAFRDVTEERGLERLKSDFVSTVSHELRTPLAAIYGAALTLRRGDVELPEEQRSGLLGVIADEAERLARIVNDILWTSRIESGGLQVTIETCDPAELARSVVEAARLHLPQDVTLSLAAGEALSRVAADPDKVRQVLANLVDNAVKYSPDGGSVEVRVDEQPGWIRFTVSDEGLGVPAGERDRVFEKFFRLDPDLTRGVGGTGLGLYICRELVRRMDGRIWLEGNAAAGTTAVVELPAAAA